LWAGVVAKGANRAQSKRRINVWASMLWGVFPDLFALTIPFVWILWSIAFGDHTLLDFGGRPPIAEPTNPDTLWLFQLSHALYNVSHSLVIFTAVFLGVWAYFKQARVELLGWLLHILMDVPTHTYAFFPTPVFWPIFDWKFNGIHWGQWWFIVLNYMLLLLAYGLVTRRQKSAESLTNKSK
jgi:hypothetical protein